MSVIAIVLALVEVPPGKNLPAAQFQQLSIVGDPLNNPLGIGFQDLDLRIGQIVLVQIGDALEQLEPFGIVEHHSGHGPRHARWRVNAGVDGIGQREIRVILADTYNVHIGCSAQ